MEQELALEMVRITESAAYASSLLNGRGDKHEADRAAVEAMRATMDTVAIDGRIVIGEGERDEAPMLYIGERVGKGSKGVEGLPQIDIAVDPLEGTNLCAHDQPNSICVLAAAERGGLLHAPDTYLEKLCVPPAAKGKVDIRVSPTENLHRIADALGLTVPDLHVIILDRDRHQPLIQEVIGAGAHVRLITDGDLSAAIRVATPGTGFHAVMGIGGAPEGVLAAAALRCLGAEIQARLRFRNQEERERSAAMGHPSEERVYMTEDLASGENIVFAATGVTDGDVLRGVARFDGGVRYNSLVMTYKTKEVRFVDSIQMSERAGWTRVQF
jgi:fructose-1,6-bisphosphatase II